MFDECDHIAVSMSKRSRANAELITVTNEGAKEKDRIRSSREKSERKGERERRIAITNRTPKTNKFVV